MPSGMLFTPYLPSLPAPSHPIPPYTFTIQLGRIRESELEIFFYHLEIDAFPQSDIAGQMMSYLAGP